VSKKTPSPAMAAALAQARLIMTHGLDAVPTSASARALIANDIDWLEEQKRQGRDSQSRKEVQTIFGFGPSKGLQVEATELESFLDGTIRRITNDSICARKIALKLLSHPVDGGEAKARQPANRYRVGPRPRTPAELAGLAKGNAKRAADAQQCREAREATRA
jgi:hypothetical protein